ncbi:hypothetical protein G6011_09399 [Alternaria panax]|uniref:Ankyrin repeat protein n=1 Tax=Alternaria panax TaxID=48097 RepID=A0AAD4IB40_9PLEO|nr:hypothetical protein G6011_09399 [Alternaria panax]
MANLLDLPAELFQMIIHELVLIAMEPPPDFHYRFKIGPVWKLRGVSRSFAAEIEREFFSQQPREFYSDNPNIKYLVQKYLPRFLMQVSRKPGSVNERFLTRLQDMGRYVVDQLDCEDQEQRAEIIEKTYVGLGTIFGKANITHALWCDHIGNCHCSKFHDTALALSVPYPDRLCAALATGAHSVLPKILPKLSVTDKDGLIPTEPLRFALLLDDLTSLDIILRHLETRPSPEQIVLTQNANMFSISERILSTLGSMRSTATKLLLDYYEKNLPCPSKDTYTRWISNAAFHRSIDELQDLRAVLSFNTGRKSLVGRDAIAAVCAHGSSAGIQEVLQHVGDVNKGTVLTAPIFIAVRSGRAAAIQACLTVGANVDLSVRSNIKTIGKTHITPLDVAVHRYDVPIADALIEGDATIPHISHWPTHARMYRLLHAATSRLTDVQLPDLQHFKLWTKEDLQALQY